MRLPCKEFFMKKFLFASFIIFMGAGKLFAVLPPFYHRLAEVAAIVEDPRLHELLSSSEMIESIVKNDAGYEVSTQHYIMQVRVCYLPYEDGRVGASRFEISFDEPMGR